MRCLCVFSFINHIFCSVYLEILHELVDICGPKKKKKKKIHIHRAVLVDARTLNKEMLLLSERHG